MRATSLFRDKSARCLSVGFPLRRLAPLSSTASTSDSVQRHISTAHPSSEAEKHTATTTTASPSPQLSAESWAAELPDIPYGFPRQHTGMAAAKAGSSTTAHPFTAEQSGGLQKTWLQRLPHDVTTAQLRTEHYLPMKEDFWRSPPYEALREVVLRTAYHDALKIIMEHDYTFLFADVMCNDEAPMPHVMYEDFMKALTFASRQRPPEEQFALPDAILRDLLCWAAYYCTLDPFYFTSASMFFRKVEQEQHLSAALHSAWVYVCTAAGKIEEALSYAAYMDTHQIPFDPAVFSLMLHPSLTPVQLHLHRAPQTSRGIVLQRRLCQDMNQHHGTAAVAVHAMFVYHMLTLRHARKWEVLRSAAHLHAELHATQQAQQRPLFTTSLSSPAGAAAATLTALPAEMISSRTMQLALSLFSREKGVRWGPRTTKAMVSFMLTEASAGATVADVVYVMMRVRRNERSGVLAELPPTVFSEAEQAEAMERVRQRSRKDPAYAVAAPLLRELFAAGSAASFEERADADQSSTQTRSALPQRGSEDGITRALRDLQELSLSATESSRDRLPFSAEASSDTAEEARPALSSAPARMLSDAVSRSEATWLGDDNLVPSYAVESTALMQRCPADVAREVLEAVMALDRESSTQHDAKAAAAALPSVAADPSSSATENLEAKLGALHASMEVMGASASLSAWSMQQAAQEAEDARLRAQVSTAWIAPTYQPQRLENA
ncbi:hypothetical protein NQL31_001522 [Lotmaria passim]